MFEKSVNKMTLLISGTEIKRLAEFHHVHNKQRYRLIITDDSGIGHGLSVEVVDDPDTGVSITDLSLW